jgi:hypothetical protein
MMIGRDLERSRGMPFFSTALSTAAVLQQQILDLSKKVEQLTKRLESEGRVRGTGEKAE